MFGLEIVDVAIGLTLMYLLLASIASVIRERWEARMKMRAVDLEEGIGELLSDPDRAITAALYNHPLISGLFAGDYKVSDFDKDSGNYKCSSTLPSYIPSKTFAQALIDLIAKGQVGLAALSAGTSTEATTHDRLRAAACSIENTSLRSALLIAIDTAQGDLAKVQANIESWFNAGMERVSGWYRRRTQTIILIVGALLTVALNVNTLTIIERLSVDGSLRQALVERANQTPKPDGDVPNAGQAALNTLAGMRLPIGWEAGYPGESGNPLNTSRPEFSCQGFSDHFWSTAWFWIFHPVIGWLITALAVSMGAPFWFDTLNRLTSLRSTLKPKEASVAAPTSPTVTVMMPTAATDQVATPAVFQPHEWAVGNPQAGVL